MRYPCSFVDSKNVGACFTKFIYEIAELQQEKPLSISTLSEIGRYLSGMFFSGMSNHTERFVLAFTFIAKIFNEILVFLIFSQILTKEFTLVSNASLSILRFNIGKCGTC